MTQQQRGAESRPGHSRCDDSANTPSHTVLFQNRLSAVRANSTSREISTSRWCWAVIWLNILFVSRFLFTRFHHKDRMIFFHNLAHKRWNMFWTWLTSGEIPFVCFYLYLGNKCAATSCYWKLYPETIAAEVEANSPICVGWAAQGPRPRVLLMSLYRPNIRLCIAAMICCWTDFSLFISFKVFNESATEAFNHQPDSIFKRKLNSFISYSSV